MAILALIGFYIDRIEYGKAYRYVHSQHGSVTVNNVMLQLRVNVESIENLAFTQSVADGKWVTRITELHYNRQ